MTRSATTSETHAIPRRLPRTMPAIAPPEIFFFLEDVLEVVGVELDIGPGVGRTEGRAKTCGEAFSSKTHCETLKVRLL